MSFPTLIEIAGQAGSGKDTLAEYLQIVYGYHRYALAGRIVKKLNARFGWTSEQWKDRTWRKLLASSVAAAVPASFPRAVGCSGSVRKFASSAATIILLD